MQLYLGTPQAGAGAPRWALKAFKRIRLARHQSRTIRFELPEARLKEINEAGDAVLAAGRYTLWIGGSSPGARSEALGAPKPARCACDSA